MKDQHITRCSNTRTPDPKTPIPSVAITASPGVNAGEYHGSILDRGNNNQAGWRSRWFLNLLALCFSLGLTLAFTSTAEAHCNVWHPHHCIEEAVVIVGSAVKEEVIDPIETFVIATGNTIEDFTVTQVNAAGDLAKKGLAVAVTALENVAIAVYKEAAELFLDQVKEPLENMAAAWVSVATNHTSDFNALQTAIVSGNGPQINTALVKVLKSLFAYNGFDAILTDFKDANAGSLMVIVSAGAGAGLTVEGDIGIAIDMDYMGYMFNQYVASPSGFGSSSMSQYSGTIGTVFIASGLQIGPAAGGGVDFVVGYHVSDPDGVNGPGLDLSLEVKATAGGSFGVGYDISQVPWQIVTAGMGIGAGAEVKFAFGPSYAIILGQLQKDGNFVETTNIAISDVYKYGSRVWGSSKGHAFDDITELVNGIEQGNNLTITKIYLRSGARVNKVGLKWSNGVKIGHGGGGGNATPLVVPSGVTLQEVKVCKDDSHISMRVHYIKFTLSDGSTVSGGTQRGSCVTLSNRGYPIVGFRGFSGNELDSLGVIYDKSAGNL